MGFMDKFKDAAAQASATVGSAMPDAGTADYAQLANKLAQTGVPCVAEIKSIGETGKTDAAGKQYSIQVHVEGNGDPYDATVEQYLIDAAVPSYQPGARFDAKADPADRSRLLLYGLASS